MKKIVIFLISATLLICSFDLNAQTDGCQFRFVLSDPLNLTGWPPERGISVTVDGVEYGFINLPWGTPSAEDTLMLPSGEIHFLWIGGPFNPFRHYFEIYNSIDELVFTSPDDFTLPEGLFFTYQNECSECLPLTDFEGEYNQEAKVVNLSWVAPESEYVTGFDILRNGVLLAHVDSITLFYSDNTSEFEDGDYKYCVIPTYPYVCDLEEKCFETYIENLGVKKYSSALSLYPNPTNHIVHIAGENVANIKIFNKIGQLIHNYNNTNRIDVSLYPAGIYIFNITTVKGEIGVYKVVVTK